MSEPQKDDGMGTLRAVAEIEAAGVAGVSMVTLPAMVPVVSNVNTGWPALGSGNAERGTRNAAMGSGSAERGTRNAAMGSGNAERGTRNAEGAEWATGARLCFGQWAESVGAVVPDGADLEEVELTRGEREHLAWLLSRAIGHGQVTLREVWGGLVRVSMNAVISATALKGEDVVLELRPGTLERIEDRGLRMEGVVVGLDEALAAAGFVEASAEGGCETRESMPMAGLIPTARHGSCSQSPSGDEGMGRGIAAALGMGMLLGAVAWLVR